MVKPPRASPVTFWRKMARVTGYDDPFVYVEHEGVDWCYNPVDGVFINLKRDRIEEPPAEVKADATRYLSDREALPDVEDLLRQAGLNPFGG